AASAFDVPRDSGPLAAAVRASLWARVFVSTGGLVASAFLPAGRPARVWFSVLVAVVAIPYTLTVLIATHRGRMRGVSPVTFAGDVAVVALFQAAFVESRPTMYTVYLVLVCFYTVVAGMGWGMSVAVFGAAADLILQVADPNPAGLNGFAFVSYLAAAAALGIIVSAATKHEREGMRRRVSTVSHELRGPVTSIEGFAATLSERWTEMEERQRIEYIRRIRRNAASVHSIIETFLDAADVGGGRFRPAIAVVPLRSFVDDLCRLCAPLVLGREVRIDVPAEIHVAADPTLLERILINLVMNAHGYSPAGEAILLEGRMAGERVEISVTDRGPGIPQPVREQIFESFWRPAGQGRRGSGIGLSLARDLVKAMDGRIWVESAPGGGSRFAVALPAAIPEPGSERRAV
ncbi:MAG TPA: HAMP domain-containing sensor histidine kinase, partial [Actinomycetota bacterium]|nr:HAMP domain-containing sensor histidine kinase [Actinomycetota bacterium]